LVENGMLLELCGFDPLKGLEAVPSAWAYSRFLKALFRHMKELDGIFRQRVGAIGEVMQPHGFSVGDLSVPGLVKEG
jgi:hypothetical protein